MHLLAATCALCASTGPGQVCVTGKQLLALIFPG